MVTSPRGTKRDTNLRTLRLLYRRKQTGAVFVGS